MGVWGAWEVNIGLCVFKWSSVLTGEKPGSHDAAGFDFGIRVYTLKRGRG